MTRTFPSAGKISAIRPAATLPLCQVSCPTKQSLLDSSISELNVITGMLSSTDSLTVSLSLSSSTGTSAIPLHPAFLSSCIASTAFLASNSSILRMITSAPSRSTSALASSAPSMTFSINGVSAAWMSTPMVIDRFAIASALPARFG